MIDLSSTMLGMRGCVGKSVRQISNLLDFPAIVLLYHRIADLEFDPQQLAVSFQNFYQHMEYLKKVYHILTIDEFQESITKRKPFLSRSLILTFDDGYADNAQQALPVLESLNVQALFYISTANIGSRQEFWWDDLERIFLQDRQPPPELKLSVDGRMYSFSTQNFEARRLVYFTLHPIVKKQKPEIREQIFQQLCVWAGVPREGRETHRTMMTTDIQKMSKSKSAVIGAHTHNHVSLSMLSYQEQFDEIQKSKLVLENLTGQKINHFSYPYGAREDYDRQSIRIVKELDFTMASANFYWQVHRWSDIYQIPRIVVRNWGIEEFKQHLKGFYLS